MTDSERADYNKLNADQREDYDYLRKKHPEWAHRQIIAKVVIGQSIDGIVDGGGGTENPEGITGNPSFLKRVLEGAKTVLSETGIFIPEVFEVIDNAITTLSSLIMAGVRYIGDKLSKFWDWFTS